MGAKQGVAQAFVTTEHSSFSAGEEIRGIVHLLVHEAIKLPKFTVAFIGKEICTFQGDGLKKGKNLIISYKDSLLAHDLKELLPGSYSIPFVLGTPKGIPGTFNAALKRFTAKIVFYIKARLFKDNVVVCKNKAEVIIEQVFENNRFSVMNQRSATVVCCDCCNQGQCDITAHIDKNAYLPLEIVRLSVLIDNSRCRRNLLGIGVTLWRLIRLKSDDNQVGVFKKCIFNTFMSIKVASGNKLLTGQEVMLELPIGSKDLNLQSCVTTLGKNVQCRYFIEITTNFGRCTNRILEFEVPLIVIPKYEPPELPSAPEDWDPIELPMARVSCTSSNPSIIDRSLLTPSQLD